MLGSCRGYKDNHVNSIDSLNSINSFRGFFLLFSLFQLPAKLVAFGSNHTQLANHLVMHLQLIVSNGTKQIARVEIGKEITELCVVGNNLFSHALDCLTTQQSIEVD